MAPKASEASPSQIAGASSPSAIRCGRFGTGILTMKRDDDLHDQRNQAPDHAVSQTLAEWAIALIGGIFEAEQGKAERNRGGRIIVADQLELVVRRNAGIDEEIGEHGHDRRAEIHQKGRQPGKGLQHHHVDTQICKLACRLARTIRRGEARAGSIQSKTGDRPAKLRAPSLFAGGFRSRWPTRRNASQKNSATSTSAAGPGLPAPERRSGMRRRVQRSPPLNCRARR